MESRTKTRISILASYLYTRWWLLFFPVLIALILGIIFIILNPSIYESRATFVIRPRTNLIDGGDFVLAMDTLIGRVEINETFAQIVESKLVRNNAIEGLGIDGRDQQFYSANASVIAGTNLLEITAIGNDPETVRAFADAVGAETVKYIENLYDVFELEPLDPARLPRNSENFSSWQIIVILLLLGLFISIGLIALVRILLRSQKDFPKFNIVDPETGAYNRDYLSLRIGEELNRSGKIDNPFLMAMIRFAVHDLSFDEYQFEGWADDIRVIKQRLETCIKEGDLLVRHDEQTFSLLFLDVYEEEYQHKVDEIQAETRNIEIEYLFGGRSYRARGFLGFVYYQNNDVVTDVKEIEDFAEYAITKAGKFNSSRIVELKINNMGEIEEHVSDL